MFNPPLEIFRLRGEGRRVHDIATPYSVFVALGSNLGDSPSILAEAMERLGVLSAGPVRRSSLWSTSPVDCPPGSPPFVNAVVALIPIAGETPESLLGKLKELEGEFGRRPKKVLNEPRPLDLDIVAWGNETRSTPSLTLPHPRAAQRQFVLRPLAEIAPELAWPGTGKSVTALLAKLRTDEVIRRLERPGRWESHSSH